jgi:phenylpropionate dioxygenase-like ring-hydroxylating dioxygenase large terminal subunit
MITDFDNEVTHLAENFMDVPHTVFVHQGWFRNRSQKQVPMTLDIDQGQVCVTYDQPNDGIGFSQLLINPLNEKMVHTDRFIFPNITRVDYQFGKSSGFIINSQITPVSTLKSRVYTYICYRVLNYAPLLKPLMRFYTRQVINQDVNIMSNQGENLKSFFDQPFRSTEADEVHLSIERLRRLGAEGKAELWTLSKSTQGHFWI